MTCKDCIHYDACKDIFLQLQENDEIRYMDEYGVRGAENECKQFKAKSRFIELPCKVGDKLWHPIPSKGKVFFQIVSNKNIYSIAIRGKIGKSVFLTREEAEAKLEEMKK